MRCHLEPTRWETARSKRACHGSTKFKPGVGSDQCRRANILTRCRPRASTGSFEIAKETIPQFFGLHGKPCSSMHGTPDSRSAANARPRPADGLVRSRNSQEARSCLFPKCCDLVHTATIFLAASRRPFGLIADKATVLKSESDAYRHRQKGFPKALSIDQIRAEFRLSAQFAKSRKIANREQPVQTLSEGS